MQANYRRFYDEVVKNHLSLERQMIFLSGPRQVGKTTVCGNFSGKYFNWDDDDHKALILKGPRAVAEAAGLMVSSDSPPVVAFDEIHRSTVWKKFLKGFFDVYGARCRIIVTGSARMDFFKAGGDSLMGRYFPYRMHPFTVGELAATEAPDSPVRRPARIDEREWEALNAFGGFPEPFVRRSTAFSAKWRRLRFEQLVREDVRDFSNVSNVDHLAALAKILASRSGEQVVYSSLAADVKISENTAREWTLALCALHHGFLVPPYHRNLSDAIRKTPKWYLRDWSSIADPGKRNETLVACHLLKAVEGWTDLGLGEFGLYYVRDKKKREVDFLVVRDDIPWFLAEVKTSDTKLSPSLEWAQEKLKAPHAFQIVMNLPFAQKDAFSETAPVCVSARTLLSQLL